MVRILPSLEARVGPTRPPFAAAWTTMLARRARCAGEPAFRGRRRNLSNALSTIRRNPIAAQMVKLMPKTSVNISQTGITRGSCASPVGGVQPCGQG